MKLPEKMMYKQAFEKWGAANQIFMVMEEAGELLSVLAKWQRGRSTREEIIDELADMQVMINQMTVMFDCEDQVAQRKQEKLRRLCERPWADDRTSDIGKEKIDEKDTDC